MTNPIRSIALAAVLVFTASGALAQKTFSFDAAGSTLEINVYKEGFFKAFAHDHLVTAKDFSGTVQFDSENLDRSSVTFRVAANSLTVLDPGESEKDRVQVQSTMAGESVLDVARYPDIVFRSTSVKETQKQGDAWRVLLEGTLQLHGKEKSVTVPLTLRVSVGELSAQGQVFLLQTDYGIAPVRIAGGTVKVKDRLRIRFEIHAPTNP